MRRNLRHLCEFLLLAAGVALGRPGLAGVLPEERADTLYHYYDGGGVQIDGPSLLAVKSFGQSVSVAASYYVDSISSASIDVVTQASPYKEERKQWGLGLDYLHDDTTMNVAFSSSEEDDYSADTLNFTIGQTIFGGLTTITLGYGSGSDEVRRRGDDTFAEGIDRNAYRIGLAQVLTRNLLLGINFETIADEGYLNNPYRQVRYADSAEAQGFGYQPEVYPGTRTTNAVGVRANYYLPYRAVVSGGYRFFTDDWGVDAHTMEIGYVQPFVDRWTVDFRYRYYTQSGAEFYSDLFPYVDAQNYLARDKELSSFTSHGPHVGVTYTLMDKGGDWPLRSTFNVFYDHIFYTYDDFRDLTAGGEVGAEPLYSYEADVVQVFLSLWF
jgi:hypothetical protein